MVHIRGWIRVGTSLSTTVPDKGSRDIAIGTLRAIVRQLDLDWEEFKSA